jgi:ankyrin repeat protein
MFLLKQDCLYKAVENNKVAIVQYLIEKRKIDVDCKEYGVPAICGASGQGNNEMIQYLLSIGANINAKNKFSGTNSLHCASAHGKHETVKLLVAVGSNVLEKNNKGKTSLQLAQDSNHNQITEFLFRIDSGFVDLSFCVLTLLTVSFSPFVCSSDLKFVSTLPIADKWKFVSSPKVDDQFTSLFQHASAFEREVCILFCSLFRFVCLFILLSVSCFRFCPF